MKLLFDQNLSFKLCRHLADLFPDSSQVRGNLLMVEQCLIFLPGFRVGEQFLGVRSGVKSALTWRWQWSRKASFPAPISTGFVNARDFRDWQIITNGVPR